MIAPFDLHSPVTWLRIFIAGVWLLFGFVFKALDAMPRHRQIVGRVLGESRAALVTNLVAAGEVSLGLWMLLGRWLIVCVGIQTIALVLMNALEIRYARDLLIAPKAMVAANFVLLSCGWYVALHPP